MTTTADAVVSALPPTSPFTEASLSSPVTRRWMWGFLLAFLVHDGEEALSIIRSGGLQALGRWETPAQSLAGITLEFTLGWVLLLLAARSTRPNWTTWSFAVLIGGWTVHGLVHLGSGILVSGYTLGVVTAVPACVVYGAVTLQRMVADRLLTRRAVALCLIAGPPVAALLIVTAHMFGRLVA